MLKTPPNAGTYYPPKIMCDGQWRYMVGVTEWHDHEHDAQEAHRLQSRVEELEAGLIRLGSVEAFEEAGIVTREVAARINFARELVSQRQDALWNS